MKTLSTFVDEETRYLQRFETYWRTQNKKNQELFPLAMNAGDWDEHFEFYKSSKLDDNKPQES